MANWTRSRAEGVRKVTSRLFGSKAAPHGALTAASVGHGLSSAVRGGALGAGVGALSADKDEDRWSRARKGALIGGLGAGLISGGALYGTGRMHNKAVARLAEKKTMAERFPGLARMLTKKSSIDPVMMAAFEDELEKIAYLKHMGIGAAIGAAGGGALGAAADDKNRFRGFVGGALGGAALGAGGGAGVKAWKNGAKAAKDAKQLVSSGGGI